MVSTAIEKIMQDDEMASQQPSLGQQETTSKVSNPFPTNQLLRQNTNDFN